MLRIVPKAEKMFQKMAKYEKVCQKMRKNAQKLRKHDKVCHPTTLSFLPFFPHK